MCDSTIQKNTQALQWQCDSLRYPKNPTIFFENFHFSLPLNQWTCLLGQSGCGKSTLLRLLAGLLEKTVHWSGQITSPIPLKGNVAYMGQEDLLLPWLTVRENTCIQQRFGKKLSKNDDQINAILKQVGLFKHQYKYPMALSGGMRQRVALARTLFQEKPFVFMDEPFSALDAITRRQLQDLTAQLLKDKTVLFITHDPLEALHLGQHIHVMRGDQQLHTLSLETEPHPRPWHPDFGQYQDHILTWLSNTLDEK